MNYSTPPQPARPRRVAALRRSPRSVPGAVHGRQHDTLPTTACSAALGACGNETTLAVYPDGPHGVTGSTSEIGRRAGARRDFIRTQGDSSRLAAETPDRVPDAPQVEQLAVGIDGRIVDARRRSSGAPRRASPRFRSSRVSREELSGVARVTRIREHQNGEDVIASTKGRDSSSSWRARRRSPGGDLVTEIARGDFPASWRCSTRPERDRHRGRQAAVGGPHPTRFYQVLKEETIRTRPRRHGAPFTSSTAVTGQCRSPTHVSPPGFVASGLAQIRRAVGR